MRERESNRPAIFMRMLHQEEEGLTANGHWRTGSSRRRRKARGLCRTQTSRDDTTAGECAVGHPAEAHTTSRSGHKRSCSLTCRCTSHSGAMPPPCARPVWLRRTAARSLPLARSSGSPSRTKTGPQRWPSGTTWNCRRTGRSCRQEPRQMFSYNRLLSSRIFEALAAA